MTAKLVIATHNPGKIEEYRALFAKLPVNILTLKELQMTDEPEENYPTFQENAIEKAQFYAERFPQFSVLAEDSGLEIDYLNGEPGVKSRRWLGRKSADQELINMTIEKLRGVPAERRGAQFRVVLALKKIDSEQIVTAEGILRGFILEKPIDKFIAGYPFRSLFYVPAIGKALGELSMKEEALIGHRRIALEKLWPNLI